MKIQAEGLSGSDLRNYYVGSYVLVNGSSFLIDFLDINHCTGHLLVQGVWVPHSCSTKDIDVCFPEEGYVQIASRVFNLQQRIQRTRRKGMNSQSYSLVPVVNSTRELPSCTEIRALNVLYTTPELSYEEAIQLLKNKSRSGVVLSKQVCITKVKGGRREVHIRNRNVGSLGKEGLKLARKYSIFEKELREHNIPIEE